jgi:hypothetical protein
MDPEKRMVILGEIERWRRSRLLPEQYCDFLRNLYLEGEAEPAGAGWLHVGKRAANRLVSGWKPAYGWAAAAFIAMLLFSGLYFTFFHPLLQTVLSAALVALLIGIGLAERHRRPLAGFAALGAGCLLAPLLGLVALWQFDAAGPRATVALTAACGVVWIAAGLAARIGLLQLSGHFALILAYLWLIRSWHGEPGLWLLQLYLVPAAAALYAAGRWIYGGIGSAGAMLMLAAGIALVAPEVYALAAGAAGAATVVLLLVGKLAAAVPAAFRRRRTDGGDGDWEHDFE